MVDEFYGEDPIPETEENELTVGIERRMALVRHEEFLSYRRSPGPVALPEWSSGPSRDRRLRIDLQPLEIWHYGPEGARFPLVLYQPTPEASYRLWYPTDSKRVLYNSEMEYFIEQLEELGMMRRGLRWLKTVCADFKLVDEATGIDGLRGFREESAHRQTDSSLSGAPGELGYLGSGCRGHAPAGRSRQIELETGDSLPGSNQPTDDRPVLHLHTLGGRSGGHHLRG